MIRKIKKGHIRKLLSMFLSTMIIASTVSFSSTTVYATTSADLSISENGIAFICAREGFHSKCYSDNTQSSIGYGTKCTGSSVQPHASGLHSITKSDAMAAMKSQINSTYVPRVRKQTTGIAMNQNQFDALVSLCYNCGGGTTLISNSPLVKYLKGELTESQARSQYSNYIVTSGGQKLQGLVNRRNLEADLFFKGADSKYSSNNPDDYTAPTTTVSYGSVGSNVAWVQAVLYQLGYNVVVDGSFGPATQEAVKNFQSDNGLDVDGSVGPITRKALLDCWNAKNRGEINIVLHTWISDSIMGGVPSSYETGKMYYLCYELIDANSGDKIDDIVSKTYSVTETMYNSDGTVKHTYTYSNDSNYIGVVQYGAGTYKCKVTVNGDITCTSETQYTINQNRVTTAHIWISEKGQGYDQADCPATDTGVVQTRYYYWYKIYDQNSGSLLSSYADKNFEVEMSIFYSDGTKVFSTTYVNNDANWISWVPQKADVYTIEFTITGDFTGTVSYDFTVDYDTKLSSSENSLSLNLNGTNSKTSTFTVFGGYPGNYGIRYSIADPSIVSCSWGGWSGNSNPLTITGLKRGSTNITVEVYENYTGNKEIVASYILPVSVVSNSYSVIYDANGGIGAPSSQTKYYNETLTLSTAKPTKTGYIFQGWSTSSTATSATYQPGDFYISNASVTLYAVWEKADTLYGDCGDNVQYIYKQNNGFVNIQLRTYSANSDTYENIYEFDGNSNIQWVVFQTGVTSIGNYMFRDCTSLSRLDLHPTSADLSCVQSIGTCSFMGCSSLTDVTLPDGLRTIKNLAFSDSALTEIIIPQSVTEIGAWAFDEDVVIYGYMNSAAEVYAETYGNKFVALDEITLTSISIDTTPTKTVYYIGDTLNTSGLKLNLVYSDGSFQTVSSGFTVSGYSSTSIGIKTVTVSYEGKTTEFTVTVNKPSITLSESSKSLTAGDTFTLIASITPSGQSVTWTSSNTSVATVIGGTITALVPGTTTITAKFTYNGITYSQTCTIIVTNRLGDVNGDGLVDAADADLISRYDAGIIALTSDQLKVGDVNGDGVVDAADAGLISRYDAGFIDNL